MLTTVSGTGLFASGTGLNQLDLNDPGLTVGQIRDRIQLVYADGDDDPSGDPVADPPPLLLPAGYREAASIFTGSPTKQELRDAFATQFALNIKDYIDLDNRLSRIDNSIPQIAKQYGMEPLPFIAEAFVQHNYETDNVNNKGGGFYDVDWVRQDTGLFAIELRNPFKVDIDLSYVSIKIGPDEQSFIDLEYTTLAAGDAVVIYFDEAGPASTTLDNLPEIAAIPNADRVDWGLSNPFRNGGTITVELITEDDQGDPVVYQIVDVADVDSSQYTDFDRIPETDLDTNTGGLWDGLDPTSAPLQAEFNTSTIGSSNNSSLLAMQSTDFDRGELNYDNTIADPPKPRDVSGSTLGEPAKVATPAVFSGGFSPTQNQILFSNQDLLVSPAELASVLILGPMEINASTTYTIAEQWENMSFLSADPADIYTTFMIDFDPVTAKDSDPANKRLPAAMTLIDQFTTLSPRSDGQDNNGDGQADDADERFIPGRINLNTVPPAVLYRALPIADEPMRQRIVDAIIDYRDHPSVTDPDFIRSTDVRDETGDFGISTIGEIMAIQPIVDEFGNDSIDNNTIGSVPIEFNIFGGIDSVDGIIDDPEEKTMVMKWLTQVGTVRSDVFAVYMVVRGYEMGKLLNPLDPISDQSFDMELRGQRHILAIVDRSNVVNADDKPRVLMLTID